MSTRSTTVRESVSAQAERFERRARAARWRARRPALLVAAAVVLALVVGLLVWFGPVVRVRSVQVVGVVGAEAEQVRQAAAGQRGVALPRVDVDAVRRAAGQLPYVAQVRVERAWPSTMRVVVQRRVPVAAVPVMYGFRLVDGAGVAYATVPQPPKDVPVVRVPLTGRPDALTAALAVIREMPPQLRSTVSDVSAASPNDVRMRRGKATVVWGSADETPLKAQVLLDLLRQKAKVYDVSAPRTPVLR